MSDDEPYDADGDVGRFLQCASPGGHMFPLSEPDGTLGGLLQFQYAPPTDVQGPPPPPPRTLNPASPVEAPAAIYGAEHDEAAPIIDDDAEDHQQLPGMDVDHQYQEEMAMDVVHPAPEMQPGYGGFFPDPTLVQGDSGVHGKHYYQVPIMDNQHHPAPNIINPGHHQDREPIMDAEQYGAAIVDGEHHHVPAMDDVETMAMDVHQQPAHMVVAQETTQQGYGYGLPDPTPMLHQGGGLDAAHYEPPPAAMDVEPPQYGAMAMEVVPPATHHMAQANGGFSNPTPLMQQDGGVDAAAAPWMEGSSMFPDPPSPTMCRMLDELAAMLQGIEGGGDNAAAGGGAEAAEGGGDNTDESDEDVGPAEDEVKFKPITHGQLDCGRCHSVREVLAIDWPSKIHFAVHSTYPETFEHAVTHRMLMGEDGQFHTYALLYMDLRGRRNEWVENFIAKSVDTMKRRNAGTVQDTNDPSTSNSRVVIGGDNNVSAPPPSNHGHMELDDGMLNNLLSAAPTATADQAANPQASLPVQEQGNTDAPPVAEEEVHEAASSEVAVQPAVAADALSVAEAAAPEAAEPAVTQAQESPDAPSVADEAAVPEVAATATSRAETRTLALDRFPPFNWEGFKPDILESSQVEPYDPASGVNVLMYPSMLEQLQLEELKKIESKKLSKMTVEDTPDYLNINNDHYANAPNFASATFKLLCQKDPTYRMFKRRVSGLNRKIKKLEQGANRVGTGGLIKIKQKMETCKQEKEELYDVIKRGMQELENESRNNDGAGPSNQAAGPSNSSPGPSNGAGPSNVASTSSSDTSLSNVSGNSNNGAGPLVVAGTSNMDAAGPSSAAGPSNVAGPSGTK